MKLTPSPSNYKEQNKITEIKPKAKSIIKKQLLNTQITRY